MTSTQDSEQGGGRGRSRTSVPLRRNQLHWFAGRTHEVLDELGDPPTWALTRAEREETLGELLALQARLHHRVLGLVAEADRSGVASEVAAPTTAAWIRSFTAESGAAAARLVKEARALEDHEPTADELAAGWINRDQAREIVAAVDALPDSVADRKPEAEQHLLDLSSSHDAKALRILGKRLVEVVAPDLADEHLARELEREEAEARRATSLRLFDDGAGTTHGRFRIPTLHGTILKKLLESFANPARPDAIPREALASPEINGMALCQLLERFPSDWVPDSGGTNLTVVVTMELDTLVGGLRAAQLLGEGELISAGEARRLACKAGVIPAVLGGKSEVLDLGRRSRLHSRPQRLAMAIEQGGRCAVERCERPATWSDAHHLDSWSHDGHTTTRDGVLICPRHHTLAHDDRFSITRLGTGKLRFHRRV